jgi:hypothetical protein
LRIHAAFILSYYSILMLLMLILINFAILY